VKPKVRCFATILTLVYLIQTSTTRAAEPKLEKVGSTYTWAQAASWLSLNQFAVGRWDGTVTLFRPPVSDNKEFGPVLTQVLKTPSGQAIQMLSRVAKDSFVTSNDDSSLAIWTWNESMYALKGTAKYEAKFGVANCAEVIRAQGKQWLVTGHAEGYLLVWELEGCNLRFNKEVNIRSDSPVPSKFPLWNVRSVVRQKGGMVVTCAEDGDVCLVEIPVGKVLTRIRYNPKAQRGINSLSISGDYILLANCSVGPDDKNLWLYQIQDGRVKLLDSANLVKDTKRPQVFNFCVRFAPQDMDLFFFASTEEGLLWWGQISDEKIAVKGNEKIECEGGGALTFEPEYGRLIVVAHAIHLYKLSETREEKEKAPNVTLPTTRRGLWHRRCDR